MLKDYKGRAPISQGEDFEASPENIEKRTTRGKFANGMKFALLQKETRGDSVSATVTLHFGTLQNLKNKAVIGNFTSSMLDKGTRTKTRQQIKDELDRLKAQVSIGGGASSATASVQTDRANLPEVLKLVREMLREPAFPADEFDKLKQEALAGLEQQKTGSDRAGEQPLRTGFTAVLPQRGSALHAHVCRGGGRDRGDDRCATPGISHRLLRRERCHDRGSG